MLFNRRNTMFKFNPPEDIKILKILIGIQILEIPIHFIPDEFKYCAYLAMNEDGSLILYNGYPTPYGKNWTSDCDYIELGKITHDLKIEMTDKPVEIKIDNLNKIYSLSVQLSSR